MREITKSLKALANERRLRVVLILSIKGPRTVGDIAKELKLSLKSTSKHLQLLAAREMIEMRQSGTRVVCAMKENPYVALIRPLLD